YEGFPSLGVAFTSTEDTHFRRWLGLDEAQGGIYLSRVLPGGSAAKAGLEKGDVLLSIAGEAIDRRGYYEHPRYGTLFWTHLVRGLHPVGSEVSLEVLRGGEVKEFRARLERSPDPLVPRDLHDQAPPYLVKGGLIFQELSVDYLEAHGKDWESKAPLELLDVLYNPEDYEEGRRRVVVLTRVIPTAATIGYERLGGHLVESVNGRKVAGLPELAAALAQAPERGVHHLRIEAVPYDVFLDETLSQQVDQQFLQSGLPALSRLYEVKEEAEEVKKEKPALGEE
ncbi:MAG: PDZ domain-containing protein, partial [Verrucomicrobiales bacterium]